MRRRRRRHGHREHQRDRRRHETIHGHDGTTPLDTRPCAGSIRFVWESQDSKCALGWCWLAQGAMPSGGLSIVVLACSAVAVSMPSVALSMDDGALVQEYRDLRSDPDIRAALASDLRLQYRFDKLDQQIRSSLQFANQANERARSAQSRQDMAVLGMLSGDRRMRQLGASAMDGPSPEDYEYQAAEAVQNARDALVEAVAGYRDIKSAVVAARETEQAQRAAAEEQAAKKKAGKKRKSSTASKP